MRLGKKTAEEDLAEKKPKAPAHGHTHTHTHTHTHDHDQEHEHSHVHAHGHAHGHDNHGLKAALGLVWGAGLLIMAIGSFNIPVLVYYILTGLTTLMSLYLGYTVYRAAWQDVFARKWGTAALYTISTLTVLIVSFVSLFVPSLPMMFETAPFILGFWHLGEVIEHGLTDKIEEQLDVREGIPDTVPLHRSPKTNIRVKALIPNDIILVKPGQLIPVDGILRAEALLDTSVASGAPGSQLLPAGAQVLSGMRFLGLSSSLEMRVSKTYPQSYLSEIAKNIEDAHKKKAPIEKFANTILKYFIPGLLGIALLSGIVVGSLFGPALAIQCVISVLVSACPCALSLITPMAVKIGMKKARDRSIHFKNSKSLQAAADIDTVVFDLNGTLTKGEFAVDSLHISDENLLGHIALLERQSPHSVGQTISSHIDRLIKARGIPPHPEELTIAAVDISHHAGVKATINGEVFMLGNQKMLSDNGIDHIDERYNQPGQGTLYIVRGRNVIGQIGISDELRADAHATVQQLQRLGKNVYICTGSDMAYAKKYAQHLGISEENLFTSAQGVSSQSPEKTQSGASSVLGSQAEENRSTSTEGARTPSLGETQSGTSSVLVSKADYIGKLKAKGAKVSMVGDHINDLEAIANSHVGIAVKSNLGNGITQKGAGMVLQKGLLFPIAIAFDVAKKTTHNIFQNLFISLTYNSLITLAAAGLFIGLGFTLSPAIGVALIALESTIVLANLYRLKQQDTLTAPTCTTRVIADSSTANVLRAVASKPPQPQNDLAFASERRSQPPLFPSPPPSNDSAVRNPRPMAYGGH
ncbi:MAG: cation-translocating P-type ATPase [Legionellaceae bacterium]|nr:cation-translocating P-type ATPase [Legionellaceae bacterium]